MVDNKIAVIIPAYKPDFLKQTLLSFTLQTNKNFTIYIGDDNSPFDIYSIVKEFEDKLLIIYTKFGDNLGATSLTKQWERCIEMSTKEEWIWLFSDDDFADPDCVDMFYRTLFESKCKFDIYKFNTTIINADNETIRSSNHDSNHLSTSDFLEKVLSFNIDSFAVEYVFRKKHYIETGKFIEFPLAWCSDIATWARLGSEKGIYSIIGSGVRWRYSGLNLSSDLSRNYDLKESAILQFLNWLKQNNYITKKFVHIQIKYFIQNATHNSMLKNHTELFQLQPKLQLIYPKYKFYIYISLFNALCNYYYLKSKLTIKKTLHRSE